MMNKYDESVKIIHNLHWAYIFKLPYKILVIGGSGSVKTNFLMNLTKYRQADFDKIYLYIKDVFESKYQLRTREERKQGLKNFKNSKAFIDYSQTTNNIYENLEIYDPTKKRKVLIAFDVLNCFLEEENSAFHVFLYRNLILQ